MRSRHPAVAAALLILGVGLGAAAESPQSGDRWAGQIFYSWESSMPEDSPLKKQIQEVGSWWEKNWVLGVVFDAVKRVGSTRRYECTQGNLRYRYRLWTRAKEGDTGRWMKTFSDDLTSTNNNDLSASQCALTLIVDGSKETYHVQGSFEVEGVSRKGIVTIEIKDENGTRRVSQPIDKQDDIDEGFSFSGRLGGRTPPRLQGSLDLSQAPFGGLEYWAKDVGGVISWRLYRGGCENARQRCLEDLGRDLDRCVAKAQSGKKARCDRGILTSCFELGEYPEWKDALPLEPLPPGSQPLTPSLRDCAQTACRPTGDLPDPDYEQALDQVAECIETYLVRGSDCLTLCR